MSLSAFTFASMPDLAAEFSITLRGKSLAARPVSWLVASLVEGALPEPPMPLVQDPAKGSMSPKIADPEDPAWRAECALVRRKHTACELAWAIGLTTDGGLKCPATSDTLDAWRAWCAAAGAEVMAKLPVHEVRAVMEQIAAYGAMKQVAEQVKN